MKQKFPLIKLFIFAGNILFPIYASALYMWKGNSVFDFIFFLFISGVLIERAWETFRTTKEHKRDEMHGDWTLASVTGAYLVLVFFLTTELFILDHDINLFITGCGFLIWIAAFRLRFWGMAALGKQWAIHAVGAQKIKKVRLIRLGPYKFVRHPIYLAIILEVLSFPIIANTVYSFLFSAICCVPLVFIRATVEEQASLRRFGAKYAEYKKEVDMLIPWKLVRARR